MTPPCGPVFVAIPVDFFDVPVEQGERRPALPETPRSLESEALERVAVALAAADFPVVVVGGEAVAAGAAATAVRVAERLGAPILAEPDPPHLPCGSLHPLYCGPLDEAGELLARADVVVHLGANTYEPWHGDLLRAGAAKRHVWFGSDEWQANRVVEADEILLGDLPAIAAALDEALTPPDNVVERRRQVETHVTRQREAWQQAAEVVRDEAPLSAARLFAELRARLPSETIVVEQTTTLAPYLRAYLPVPDGAQYVAASGSCQGWGLGAAVGVKLARPDTPVLAVVGDGSFMFGVQALWSAVRHAVPLTIVICSNGGWRSMQTSLERFSPDLVATGADLGFGWEADYTQLARSLGANAVAVADPDELRAALAAHEPGEDLLVIEARCRPEARLSGWVQGAAGTPA